jgi:Ca-activated chloride channel family protein
MKDWLGSFHFLRPEWLWLLLAAPVIYFTASYRDDMRARCRAYIDAELLDHLIIQRRSRWQLRPIHTLCILILLGSIALAGPTWKREPLPFTEDKAPLVIAVDLSRTMDAIDLDPTRLERVKLKVRDLLKARDGGRTALFVYAGSAHMVLPFTTDRSLLDLYVNSLSTSIMPVAGKNTAQALHTIQDFLKDEPVPGTILFITDGVEPRAVPILEKFSAENDDRNDIIVLGAGTTRGAPVRLESGGFLTEATGARVYSKLDVAALRAMNSGGVPSSTLTLDDDDISWIQRHVQHHLHSVQQNENKTQWVNEGYWLTIPIALVAMFWFRKGWTVRWSTAALAITLIVSPLPQDNSQPASRGFNWLNLWLTPDQQGRYFFEKGRSEEAADHFEDPMWKGFALAHSGRYEDALNEFAISDSADAWFNQGDALAHLRKYPEAAHAFHEALARRSPWPVAQENLDLVTSLIPPEKKNDQQEEDAPEIPPDKVQYDDKGKKATKKVQLAQTDPAKLADIWMRNIQTTPADFLKRRFAMQAAQEKHGIAQP